MEEVNSVKMMTTEQRVTEYGGEDKEWRTDRREREVGQGLEGRHASWMENALSTAVAGSSRSRSLTHWKIG